MRWILVAGQTKVRLKDKAVIGREDFPAEPRLSRDHVKFEIKDTHVSITDLGSTNGTYFQKRKLTPNVKFQLRSNDVIRVGETEFKLLLESRREISNDVVDGLLLTVLLAVLLADPSMAFGRSVGLTDIGVLLGMVLIPYLYSTAMARFLIFKRTGLKFRLWIYCATVLALTLGLNFVLMKYVFSKTDFMVSIVQKKVSYFCELQFDWNQCLLQINRCPKCATSMSTWEKTAISQKLKSAAHEHPEIFSERQPTTVK